MKRPLGILFTVMFLAALVTFPAQAAPPRSAAPIQPATPAQTAAPVQSDTSQPAKGKTDRPRGSGLGPKLELKCTCEQDRVIINNNLGGIIPPGTQGYVGYNTQYTTYNFGIPSVTYPPVEHEVGIAPLGPGQTRSFPAPGLFEQYGCRAWLYGGLPDLQVARLQPLPGQFVLSVRNANTLVDAGSSTVHIKYMKCPETQLADRSWPVPPIPKGSTQSVAILAQPDTQYVLVTLDANNAVMESNEGNNDYTGVGACLH